MDSLPLKMSGQLSFTISVVLVMSPPFGNVPIVCKDYVDSEVLQEYHACVSM